MAIIPENQYPGKIDPSSPEYPYGQARNITLPGDGTGTPWEAALVNDILGWQQALLEAAAVTPSGTPDEVGASQYLQSLNRIGIMAWNTATTYENGGMSIGSDYQIYVSQSEQSGNDPVTDGGVNWVLFSSGASVPDAAEGVRGIAELATQDDVNNGTDDEKIVTPLKLGNRLAQLNVTATSPVSLFDADVLEFVTDYQIDDINKTTEISAADAESGTLIDAEVAGYFDLVVPYMVLIGDSIAEGHPALHGRLDPGGVGGYDPNYVSLPGQLSYEFARLFGLPVVNQGIGSQTSTQIRDRWSRDVLALTSDPGDGRGSNTLEFGGQAPYAVYIHVGINDVFGGATAATIQDNFTFFAQSCRDNNLTLIVDNIGPESNISPAQIIVAEAVNAWLISTFKTNFPEVQIIDYLFWGSNGTNDLTVLRPGLFADSVHPNEAGYTAFAQYSAERVTQPVFLQSITLNSTLESGANEPSRFSRIVGFNFNGANYAVSGAVASFALTDLASTDDPVVRLTPTNYELITGAGGNQYAGFAQIIADFGSVIERTVFQPGGGGSGGVVAAGMVLGAAIAPVADYYAFGITSIDATDLANGNVIVNLTNTATHLVVNMIGVDNTPEDLSVRWFSGQIPAGQTSWTINVKDVASNNISAANRHNYQIIAYNFL